VKGAYREPAGIAFPRKADVDANYLSLARRLLADDARKAGVRAVFGTHDNRLLRAIAEHASAIGLPAGRSAAAPATASGRRRGWGGL